MNLRALRSNSKPTGTDFETSQMVSLQVVDRTSRGRAPRRPKRC